MKLKLPSLPPGIGGAHAIALGASAALMTATAGFRAVYGGFDLTNILLSGCVLGWDLGITGMVHWSGYRIAASRAKEDQYEIDALAVQKAKRELSELGEKRNLMLASLARFEAERAQRIAFDFQLVEVKAWASALITSAYVRAVNIQRGGRFSKD